MILLAPSRLLVKSSGQEGEGQNTCHCYCGEPSCSTWDMQLPCVLSLSRDAIRLDLLPPCRVQMTASARIILHGFHKRHVCFTPLFFSYITLPLFFSSVLSLKPLRHGGCSLRALECPPEFPEAHHYRQNSTTGPVNIPPVSITGEELPPTIYPRI